MAPKGDGYESDSEYESALEDQEEVKKAATDLTRRSSKLSSEVQSVVGNLTEEVLSGTNIYQTPSNQPIYATPQKGNNASRNVTSPPLPSSSPPSTLSGGSNYVNMSGKYGNHSNISSGAESDLQQYFNNGSRRLSSVSISESEMSNAVNQAVEVVFSPEVQERLKNKINNDKSFLEKIQKKWNSLDNKGKSLFGLGAFGIAVGAPVAIVALPVLATVAAVAGLAIAIIGGLKLATPSKAKFKKTGQEMMHSAKNAANVLPHETNLERLWKSIHKPGVTSKNPNLEDFLTKYCFPDQESGKEVKVKFDPDKIEALKATVKTVGLDLDQDIDRMVKKGDSIFRSDYAKTNKDGTDTQFIQTIDDVATKVMAKDHRIEDKFKDKLTEIKQIKATEKTAEKKNSFLNVFRRNQSHTESVATERRESDSSQGRST